MNQKVTFYIAFFLFNPILPNGYSQSLTIDLQIIMNSLFSLKLLVIKFKPKFFIDHLHFLLYLHMYSTKN